MFVISAYLPAHAGVFASCGNFSRGSRDSEGGEAPLHFFAQARAEEVARGAVERLLESAVTLRVAAEAGVDRGDQKAAVTAFNLLNEPYQPQAGSGSDQGQAEVPVEVAAHLARIAVDQARQLIALQVGPSQQRAERAHCQRVMVGHPRAQSVCLAPDVAHVTLDRRCITARHLNGARRLQALERFAIEP